MKAKTLLIIKPTDKHMSTVERRTQVDSGASGYLATLQSITGGYIELVHAWTKHDGRPCNVYANEEGKRLELPVNEFATKLWFNAISHLYPSLTPANIDRLRGNVIIVLADTKGGRS